MNHDARASGAINEAAQGDQTASALGGSEAILNVPQPRAEKPSGSMPPFSLWLGGHLALISAAALLVQVYAREGLGWVVVCGPSCLGLVQAAVLWRRLPTWAAILWPVATAFGGVLSVGFGWFLYFGVGLCLGVCQAGLLGAARFRWWFLWPVISGLSWLSVLVVPWAFTLLFPTPVSSVDSASILSLAMGLIGYAFSTGLALQWMGRRSATAG